MLIVSFAYLLTSFYFAYFTHSLILSCMELKSLLRTTPKYINILASNGITDLKQLMLTFPRTYEDRQEIKTLSKVTTDGTLQTVK